MYIKRNIEELIDRCSKQFACITLYGSRQVGKSTVINKVFNDKYEHVNLDNLQNLNMAINNPKLFLETYKWPVVIDNCKRIMPVNENVYYCPVSMIGL